MKTVSALKRKAAKSRTRVKQLREEANLSLREIIRHAGVSVATLSRVEGGKAPDIRTALRLAQFYETSVEDLFGGFR